MDFISRITYESKVIPGVVVTFKRVTATTRAAFSQSVARYRAQIREIQRQRKPLDDAYNAALVKARAAAKIEVDALIEAEGITREEAEGRVPLKPEFPDDQFAEWADLMDQQRKVEADSLGLSGLRSQLVSVEGFTIAGAVPSVDVLIDEGPDELTAELVKVANEIAGLSPQERGESPWPGTSPQVGDGTIPGTPAVDAANQTETV